MSSLVEELEEGGIDIKRAVECPSNFVEELIGVEPFEYQRELMDAENDRKIFASGRQVGKSRTAAWIALYHALTNKYSNVLITASAQRQASELFNQVKHELHLAERNKNLPTDIWGIDRDTQTEIEFSTNSRIKVVPVGRDGSNIRGFTADVIIVDEAAFIEEQIFQEVLKPMLYTTDGLFMLSSTPYGQQGFFWKKWNDDRWYKKRVASWESPLIDREDLEEDRRQMTDEQFRQEVMGKFREGGGGAFDKQDVIACMAEKFVDAQGEHRYLAVDPARHGKDEAVFLSMCSEGNAYNIQTLEDCDTTEVVDKVKNLHRVHDYDHIVIDATGVGGGVFDPLKRDLGKHRVTGFEFNSIQKKQEVFNTLQRELENGNVTIPNKDEDEHGDKLFMQLDAIEYDTTNSGYTKFYHPDKDSGGRDDYVDALGLAVWIIEENEGVRASVSGSSLHSGGTMSSADSGIDRGNRTQRPRRRGNRRQR